MMVTLPQPSGGFRWVQLGSKPALRCEALEPFARHFFTTKSWRLGSRVPDAPDGWPEVAEAADVDPRQLVRLTQVHGADVATYAEDEHNTRRERPRADIAVSDTASFVLTVQTADCLPVLLVARRSGAVAAAHAGWRGLVASVPRIAIDRLASDFGCDRRDILVAIGPAIGACCYEVGDDVRARFEDERFSGAQIGRWFRSTPARWSANPPMTSLSATRRPNHWFFDTWSCAREQLQQSGVPAEHIFTAELCTASHEAFCSYRRDGAVAGRMAAVIGSKKLEVRS